MAASMAAMSVTDIVASPLGQVEIEPNHIVDKLIPEIIYAATNKSVVRNFVFDLNFLSLFIHSNLYRIFAANFCHCRT